MRNVLHQLSRNGMPGSNSDWENPLPVNIRTENGPAISSDGPNLVINNIGNPNGGNRGQSFLNDEEAGQNALQELPSVPVIFEVLSQAHKHPSMVWGHPPDHKSKPADHSLTEPGACQLFVVEVVLRVHQCLNATTPLNNDEGVMQTQRSSDGYTLTGGRMSLSNT